MRIMLPLILVTVCFGCSKSLTESSLPGVPSGLPGYVRSDDAGLSLEESKAVLIARSHLEKMDGRPLDAYFRVRRADDEFHVHVEYVTGYEEDGRPIFIPGGHCEVILSKEWEVVKILPGA